jgi:hypothetical protein
MKNPYAEEQNGFMRINADTDPGGRKNPPNPDEEVENKEVICKVSLMAGIQFPVFAWRYAVISCENNAKVS